MKNIVIFLKWNLITSNSYPSLDNSAKELADIMFQDIGINNIDALFHHWREELGVMDLLGVGQ